MGTNSFLAHCIVREGCLKNRVSEYVVTMIVGAIGQREVSG